MVAAGDGRDIVTFPEIARDYVGYPTDAAGPVLQTRPSILGNAMFAKDTSFDPETLRVLQSVFEEVAATLPNDAQTEERKMVLASRILALASNGEADPVRLRTAALLHLLPRAASEEQTIWSGLPDNGTRWWSREGV
jgi:hypothetical protein